MPYPHTLLSQFPFKAYVVGGAVRDYLLGRDSNDLDIVVVGESPQRMLDLGGREVSKSFPIYLFDGIDVEFALARRERNTPFIDGEYISLEDDLSRRDLTINAMAMDENGRLYDLFGGVADAKAGILRHVSHHFSDDPDRIFRVARFAAQLDFQVAPETMALMKELVLQDLIETIDPERLTKEFTKALLAPYPRRFFEILDDVGALARWLPELSDMRGVPQRADFHAEGDVWIHNMMVLDEAVILSESLPEESKLRIRTAALFHDIGKTKTKAKDLWNPDGSILGKHPGHESEYLLKPMFESMRPRLRGFPMEYVRFASVISQIHQKVHRCDEMGGKAWMRLFDNCGERRTLARDRMIEDIGLACEADHLGRLKLVDGVPKRPEAYPQAERFRLVMETVMRVEQGPIFLAQRDLGRSIEQAKDAVYRARLKSIALLDLATVTRPSAVSPKPGI